MKNLLTMGLLFAGINCLGVDREEVSFEKKGLFTEEEYKIYCAARRLADLVLVATTKLAKDPNYFFELHIDKKRMDEITDKEGVNPYWSRTKQGLFLEVAGQPRCIWTPWGRLSLAVGSYGYKPEKTREFFTNYTINLSKQELVDMCKSQEQFYMLELSKLGVKTTMHIPRKQYEVCGAGQESVYMINKIAENSLIKAVADNGQRSFHVKYEETESKWVAMTKRYNLEKKVLAAREANKREQIWYTEKSKMVTPSIYNEDWEW